MFSRCLPVALAALSLFATAIPVAAAGPFADDKLAEAVGKALKKKPADLKDGDLANLFILEARGAGITNLAGLEKCTNLALVHLPENEIADLGPLAGLVNVQSLDLSGNKVSNLGPLAKLVKLQYVKAEENAIADLRPLAGLAKLTSLYIAGNKVRNLEPLAGLKKLTALDLDRNAVQDIGPLATLEWLATIGLRGNKVKSVAPLAGMTELRYTFLEGNQVADLAPLVEMARKDAEGDRNFAPYWRVYVKDNPLSAAATKEQIPALRKLGVRVDTGE